MANRAEKQPTTNPFLASFSLIPRIYPRKFTSEGKGSGYIDEVIDFYVFTAYENFPFHLIPEMSRAALKVLMYILRSVRYNQDYLEIKYYDAFDPEHPYRIIGKNIYYSGIKELTLKGIIASRKDRGSTYWINPSMFFSGSRLKAYPDYVNYENAIRLKSKKNSNTDESISE